MSEPGAEKPLASFPCRPLLTVAFAFQAASSDSAADLQCTACVDPSELSPQVALSLEAASSLLGEVATVKEELIVQGAAHDSFSQSVTTQLSVIDGELKVVMSELEVQQGKVDGLSGTTKQLLKDSQETSAAVTSLNKQAGELDAELTGLSAQVTELDTVVKGLQGDMSNHSSALEGVTGDVSALQAELKPLQTKVTGLESELAGLKVTVEANGAEIKALKPQLTVLSDEFKAHEAKLSQHLAPGELFVEFLKLDGPGTGLDADTLDGYQAADLMGTSDLQCTGCVGTTDLAGGAVTKAKLADDSVGSFQLAAGAVLADDIAEGSVLSVAVLDGTLKNIDINHAAGIEAKKIAGYGATLDSETWSHTGKPGILNFGEGTLVVDGFSRMIAIGFSDPDYDPSSAPLEVKGGALFREGWVKTTADKGIMFSTHGGGFHMTDTSYVRVYGDKHLWVDQSVNAGGGLAAGTFTDLSWGGWNVAMELTGPTPTMIHHPASGLGVGFGANKKFYVVDTVSKSNLLEVSTAGLVFSGTFTSGIIKGKLEPSDVRKYECLSPYKSSKECSIDPTNLFKHKFCALSYNRGFWEGSSCKVQLKEDGKWYIVADMSQCFAYCF